jgi:hypothetical protein
MSYNNAQPLEMHINPEHIIITYTSRSKCIIVAIQLLILIGIIFSPAFMILSGRNLFPWVIEIFYLAVSIIGMALLFPLSIGPLLIFCVYRAVVRYPAVSLSAEGIHDTSSFLSPGLIRWNEFSSFSTYLKGSKRWLVIITHDPKPILDRMPIIKRIVCKISFFFEQSPFMIPEFLIEGSIDDLVVKIQDYYELNIKPILNESLGIPEKPSLVVHRDNPLGN